MARKKTKLTKTTRTERQWHRHPRTIVLDSYRRWRCDIRIMEYRFHFDTQFVSREEIQFFQITKKMRPKIRSFFLAALILKMAREKYHSGRIWRTSQRKGNVRVATRYSWESEKRRRRKICKNLRRIVKEAAWEFSNAGYLRYHSR